MRTAAEKSRIRMQTADNKDKAWEKHFQQHPKDNQAIKLIEEKRKKLKR